MGVHEGRVAVITGGASGIGRGCAERFVRDGASVVIADVDLAAARATAAALGARAVAIPCDVTDEAAVERAMDAALERFGRLDYAINNAGVITVDALVDIEPARWRRLLDVNVTGVYLASRAAARRLIAQGSGGCIVNGSSGSGRRGSPYLSAYCASKAAIIALSQSLAQELATHRIRVNCYTPGHVETPLWESIADGFARVRGTTRVAVIEGFRAGVPWGRFGTPAEVAAAVSWACSPDAEYMSGQCLAMNGAQLPW